MQNIEEGNGYATRASIIPKHYRLIINPTVNETQQQFSFNGNVWITITPTDDSSKTIELDVQNLDIRADDVSVYRSRILSDLNFQSESTRAERSAKLVEDDDGSGEDAEFDMLMNSTEWIDSNVTTGGERESQELAPAEEAEENAAATTTDQNEAQNVDGTEINEDSSEPTVTEEIDYSNVTTATWDGLLQNDSMLVEPNPNDQTELQIDGIRFDTERKKLIISLRSALRKGHYYIVKVFFGGYMTDDYGLVYKSYDGTESTDKFS